MFDYVKAGNAAQGLVGPRQPLADGGIKALRRGGSDFLSRSLLPFFPP